jgi:hypothetical protein
MFLTVLDHEGLTWTVDLKVVPVSEQPGTPEFSFTRPGPAGESRRFTWQASGDALEALQEAGVEVSEDLLCHQLTLELAEARTMMPLGSKPT